ncbi:MAG: LicD family protein [Lachnospiraceae bacterium]|nr:LicD family protein [Lachnospiraceae bacterium]
MYTSIDELLRKDFYSEETICDFTVTELRKKIWAKELEILVVFDRICRENNLKYYLQYGTLIGAVRHKGFIPWDDDVDVEMFRPDYEKAKEILKQELEPPYEWQDMYTVLENPDVRDDTALKLHPFGKIKNSNTAAIEEPGMPVSVNQGIYIDIFPIDDARDDKGFTGEMLELQKEVYYTIFAKDELRRKLIEDKPATIVPYGDLEKMMDMPLAERFKLFESLMISYAGKSTMVNNKFYEIRESFPNMCREWYDRTVELPVEGIGFSAAEGYESILSTIYGDYMKPVRYGAHTALFDPDNSYRDYYDGAGQYIGSLK